MPPSTLTRTNLKYGYAIDKNSIYYKEEWLCDLLNFTYSYANNDENREVINIMLKVPTLDNPKQLMTIYLPLESIIKNEQSFYENQLPFYGINITDNIKIRGKIRDYFLFVRFIDQSLRKHVIDLPKTSPYFKRKKLKEYKNDPSPYSSSK